MNIKYLFLAFMAIPLLSSCDDDEDVDTTKPVIEIESPMESTHFHAGENFDLKALITDNDELASWKINIHFNPNGHVHQKSSSISSEQEIEWEEDWSDTIDAGLNSFNLTQNIVIPIDAEHGEYHLGVFALDKSGNDQVVYIAFEVEDAEHEH